MRKRTVGPNQRATHRDDDDSEWPLGPHSRADALLMIAFLFVGLLLTALVLRLVTVH